MWMDNGRRRTPDHGYTISSPCEPEGSGELKKYTGIPADYSLREECELAKVFESWDHQWLCLDSLVFEIRCRYSHKII